MGKIVSKFIDEVREKVREKGVKLKINKDAVNWLIERGFDKKMGARPLQRVIDKEIKRPLAKLMLCGDLKHGGTLTVDSKENKIILIAKSKLKVADETTIINPN